MSGVVVIVCIPTEEYEKTLVNNSKTKSSILKQSQTIYHESQISRNDTKSNKTSVNASNYELNNHDLDGYQTMHKLLETILKQMEVQNATWSSKYDKFQQIMFSLDSVEWCKEILQILQANNIGRKFKSSVSVIPCTVYYQEDENEEELDEANSIFPHLVNNKKNCRLAVAQIVENLKIQAALTFDFIGLILISTILCAIGLTENSDFYLLSSMLISPMMGPVMAGTFGSVIHNKSLQKIGVQNELFGLGLATFVGFVYGTIICLITDKYGNQDWPTYEMTSRGELHTLWVGCLIALLSGAAFAQGILSDNIASLVGVAISTSLMPPAVNAGLLWSLSLVYYLKGTETTRYTSLTFSKYYTTNKTLDLLALGGISMCLTFVNIICIYLAGILVFKIKEVAPMSTNAARRQFWRHDIKVARDYNKTLHKGEVALHKDCLCHSFDLIRENFKINTSRQEHTWAPRMNAMVRPSLRELYGSSSSDRGKNGSHKKGGEEKLGLNKENSRSTGSKKFVVTPCETDPLLK